MRVWAGAGGTHGRSARSQLRGTFRHRYLKLSFPECIMIIVTGLVIIDVSFAGVAGVLSSDGSGHALTHRSRCSAIA